MLGPLQVGTTTTAEPMPVQPAGEPGRPGQQAPSTIFLPRDAVAEAEAAEARTRELWRKHCPEVFNAREELDQAEAANSEAFRIHRERQTAVMTCKDRLSNASPLIMGEVEDRRSALAIAEGFAAVAEHNAAWAAERLREAREKLAAATAPALVQHER
jgi:hypothetical protein